MSSVSASGERLLAILDLFSEERPLWSPDEMMATLGYSRPTLYRYLKTLKDSGYLTSLPQSGYMLGPRVTELDFLMRRADPLIAANQARERDEAIAFLEESRDGPFFLYLAHTFPHIPLFPSAAHRGESEAGTYGDVVEDLDWSTGRLLDALARLDLEDDTLVLVTSDNGPWFQGSPGIVRGRKNQSFEGGPRVPIVSGITETFYNWLPIPAAAISDDLRIVVPDGVHVNTSEVFRVVAEPTISIVFWSDQRDASSSKRDLRGPEPTNRNRIRTESGRAART